MAARCLALVLLNEEMLGPFGVLAEMAPVEVWCPRTEYGDLAQTLRL